MRFVVSISVIAFIFSSEITSEVDVAFAPPDNPLPAPRAITGMLWVCAYLTAAATSSVLFARRTIAAAS